jgi:uncharacterized protein (DUF58 family)
MNTVAAPPSPDPGAADRILRRLDWRIIRKLDGFFQGDYRSLFYGHGLDFADLREYQTEDDIRYIDWNVTARMNSLHVRQYIEEREVTAWFLLDLSPSMGFGRLDRHKDTVLIDFVATLARLLTRNGNRVGAIFYNNHIERTISPGNGRAQVLRLTHELLKRKPSQDGAMTDLSPLLTTALNTLKKRSLVFLVSDFISLPGWEKPFTFLNRRHDLLPIRLWDPREIELPDIGLVRLEDAETGEQLVVDTRDKKFRRRFYEAAQQREDDLAQTFKRAGVDVLALSTQDDLVRVIVRFATLRKRAPRLNR